MFPEQVKILRGKYKGQIGWWCCFTEPHHLSTSKRRAQIRVYGANHRTLLLQESGYEILTYQPN